MLTQKEHRSIVRARTEQARRTYDDVRGKLVVGVQEAYETVSNGQEEIRLADESVQEAEKAHAFADDRIKNNVQGSSNSEVLQALQMTALAQVSYLRAVSSYNKAQLRLLLLTGRWRRRCLFACLLDETGQAPVESS